MSLPLVRLLLTVFSKKVVKIGRNEGRHAKVHSQLLVPVERNIRTGDDADIGLNCRPC